MSPITKEFTKEQLQQIIETDHVQCGEASSLARIALASLEAEPVAWAHRLINKRNGVVHPWVYGSAEACPSEGDIFNIEVMPLYTVPPAPVSVPAAMEMDDDFDSAFEHGKAVGWNAYRAAMLQAEPVSNSDELPLDYLQGHKDGLEWAAQLAEANHPQTGDWLYDDPIDLARAISKGPDMPTAQAGNHTEQHLDMVDHSGDANKMVAGNSPVIPDGWKLVPIDPTKDMLRAGQSVVGFWLNTVHCYSKMLAAAPAAPQQEVTQALAKGMERYGDAMQKLADSGD
ncbi:Uncharacterised protein [Escherichia coli]|nr:DUF551 domain-containing protein [Escherichia coli]VVY45330.1 Uncharacterised protein [Escherichia coli]VVY46019.1 Uncharacterised protein [Escherichia coli]VVY46227.1 Uncharacterised protein [Escherichia coli]VVY50798.1 Uncharacterised protein [Escherichia coli]VVY51834.1 Uncharacterised protein [Escherichia coli]